LRFWALCTNWYRLVNAGNDWSDFQSCLIYTRYATSDSYCEKLVKLSRFKYFPPKPAGLDPQIFRRRTLYYMRKSLGIILFDFWRRKKIWGEFFLDFFLGNAERSVAFGELFLIYTRYATSDTSTKKIIVKNSWNCRDSNIFLGFTNYFLFNLH
jgi:hypothetical protein